MQGEKVLVLDDSKHDASLIVNAIDSSGGMGWAVTSVEAARLAICAVRFDAVTLDLNLGGSADGLQAWLKILNEPALAQNRPSIFVISIGELTPEQWQTAKNLGVKKVMKKPFNAQALISALEYHAGTAAC